MKASRGCFVCMWISAGISRLDERFRILLIFINFNIMVNRCICYPMLSDAGNLL